VRTLLYYASHKTGIKTVLCPELEWTCFLSSDQNFVDYKINEVASFHLDEDTLDFHCVVQENIDTSSTNVFVSSENVPPPLWKFQFSVTLSIKKFGF